MKNMRKYSIKVKHKKGASALFYVSWYASEIAKTFVIVF